MLMENKKNKPIVLYDGSENVSEDIIANFELMRIYRAQC